MVNIPKIIIHLFFTLAICNNLFSQRILKGIVTDSDSKGILPYVNIGIRNKNIGTISQAEGKFSIQIPFSNEYDTLTFSMVGYSELNLPIWNITNDSLQIFNLTRKTNQLKTVNIFARKLEEKKFGITNIPLLQFADGSINQNDIFEIAQLIKLDNTLSKITSLNLYINESRNDSETFRINFYGFNGSRPTERILEKSIVQRKAIQQGWLKMDLINYNIWMKGKFIVSLEFIPTEKKTSPVYYGIKLGGSSKSFVRTSSQGEWTVPPHHYRMFITSFVSNSKDSDRKQETDNKESIPSETIYSKAVADSFSIFINLPVNYKMKSARKYPVYFLLDANVYFDIVADEMRTKKMNAILVGIGYKDFLTMDSLRDRDYTFPKADPKFGFVMSGGGDKFFTFIQQELIPWVNKNYHIDPSNFTLAGHSLGGYFTLYALTASFKSKQSLFKNYIAASPSLEYSKYIFDQIQIMDDSLNNEQNLFITFGGREDTEDGEKSTEGMDNFQKLISLLSDNKYSKIKLTSKLFPDFMHMETAVPSFIESLKYIK